ncbi:SDR family NAD(P)-dependent oxidoreductase [Krasilnikovia sp. MM14-A1259]|uniref:SDR family NAD(P)-dependent oxidoreductase n=1 Tax=Krasilnikovia sp. MM14-A1259 TaxID=3373539 RepID=UPI0037F1CD73
MANEDKLRDYLKRVTTDLHQTRERLRELEESAQEPMAIVGMACSFPGGVSSPDEFWELLAAGRDAVGGFPDDRGWAPDVFDPDPDAAGRSYSNQGGFLYDAGRFDAQFFGISPREALVMDPQQRLLLETSWHALEDAGIDPATLHGSATGVFAGLIYHDYLNFGDVSEEVAGYLGTGASGGVASGRVAYALGLEGPAVTVDTACSSSLVAVHLACQSLRSGESDLALAGGVTVMSTPGTFIDFSRQRGLAPDGRCKAFAEAADGTGWGEGVGVLVLERLSDAQRLGHRVLGVVAGSAVNQDGASNGLTAPSGLAQQRVIRSALANAGIGPEGVDVVEGHGTGTRLGDPIEAQALLAAYGQGRDRPLWLGSVKSNIGHTQAAAGVAGIIKVVAAMRRGVIPATLHVDRPSSHVEWGSGSIRLATEVTPWPVVDRPRRAGVSSFGFSGTNAHVIIEQAPEVEADEPAVDGPRIVPWLVSARTPEALTAQADHLAGYVSDEAPEPADVAWSLATTRSALEHRAVVLGADRDELLAGLRALAEGRETPAVITAAAPTDLAGKTGFVFTGQGAQRIGMGRQLYEAYPVFAEAFDAVCAGLEEHLGGSLAAVIAGGAGDLDQTMWTQAGLFALEVALYRLLESWGVTPSVVAGHSIGELAAAHVAGVWSLPDACAVVAARGRFMQELPAGGAMIAIEAGEERVAAALAGRAGAAIAAVNGPKSVVVSGVEADVEAVAAELAASGARTRRLQVSHAFHSPLMDPMLERFARVVASVGSREPRLTLVSTRTGRPVTSEVTDPGYWVGHVRDAVRFADAAGAMRELGVRTFVEIGPDGILSGMGQRIPASHAGPADTWLPALRRGRDEMRTLLGLLSRLHVRGHAVDWAPVLTAPTARRPRRITLPAYAFQRDHYWLTHSVPADVAGLGQIATHHPLLGATIDLPATGVHILTGHLAPAAQPWLADHTVGGRIVLPGTALIDMVIRAGDQTGCSRVEELLIETPLVLHAPVRVQVVVEGPDEAGRRSFGVYAQAEDTAAEPEWTRHATGVLAPAHSPADDAVVAWPPAGADEVDLSGFYPSLAGTGLGYGPVFQGVRAAWRHAGDLYADVELPAGVAVAGFGLHPALLDAALQVAGLDRRDGPRLPFAWGDVTIHATGATRARVRITAAPSGDGVSLTLADSAGGLIASVGSLVLRPVDPGVLAADPAADVLHRVEWIPAPAADPGPDTAAGTAGVSGQPSRWAMVDAADGLAGLGDGPAPDVVVIRAVPEPAADVAQAARNLTLTVLAAAQQWLAADELAGTRLLVATQRAVDAGPENVPDPVSAPAWGLVGTLQSENAGRVLLADVEDLSAPGLEAALRAGAAADEPRFAIRSGQVRVPRLTRAATGLPVPAGGAWQLGFHERGTLDNLTLLPAEPARPLRDGEVRVAIRAAGVNFRDVLNVLGMYPGEAGRLGLEGAGVVVETGPGVSGLRVGDTVMGLFTGAFTGEAITDARLLAPVPDGWTMAQAAAAPVVYLTAWYALVELAGLREGESILVHAAAGGVGMAAVQLAHHLGARILATASPGKQAAVRDLGVDASQVASSRTTDFEATFRAVTGGHGVDVVLDSLAGEFVDASLRLTRPGGRFIEMGKTDIRDAADVQRAHQVAYQAFDLLEQPADAIAAMMASLLPLFASGVLRPLPVTAWDAREAVDAFRFVSQARHVGKVVLTAPAGTGRDAAVLITGASGALGGEVARHLAADHRSGSQVLVSRRGPRAPGTAVLAAEVAECGVTARVLACDVADPGELAGLLAGERLTDVVHAAGVLDDGVVAALTPQRVTEVMRAKVDAAWHLHRLTADRDLASFVVFSSIAGVVGNVGQANYAAANTFLDALAALRRRQGLPAVSVAWGPWEAGMAGELHEADRQRMARQGLRPLPSADGLALLDAALDGPESLLVAARLDLPALRRAEHVPVLMSALVRGGRRDTPHRRAAGRSAGGTGNALAALTPAERREAVRDIVLDQAALVLGMAGPGAIDAGRTFRDVGFDSLTAVELRNRLNAATGLRLPATAVFDHPTPTALAEFVAGEITGEARTEIARASVTADADRLVIVGMACSFPGGVSSPDEFWELLAAGRDAVGGFPDDRGWATDVFDPDPEASGKSYTDQGAFLARAGEFDAQFFGISPREALVMDPQQRLLLETSWHALEDAGIDPATLHGSATGVFSGLIYHDYLPYGAPPQEAEGYLGTGGSGGVASGRIAYALGLEGPAVTLDTACSSSLVAVHLACQSLRSGESDLALAGGVTVMSTPGTFIDFSRQRGLAPDGRCKAFAEAADGTGWGEGVGVLVLERLSDAQRLGHRVLGVVAGSAVNQDGASNGLTAPSGLAQQRVIRSALANAGIGPEGVDVVEGHGTGTRLGDPIEAQALLAAYGQGRDRPLWLGSVKSNIGHTQAAAGVAGIIKVVAAMRRGVIPATLHVDRPSSHVEWGSGSIRLATEVTPWPVVDRPRRAGVSSFGFSGTNAHVIIEQAPEVEADEPAVDGPRIVPWLVSARTPEALTAQARQLVAFARSHPEAPLQDIGLSLATTRAALEHRAAVIGTDRDELVAGLEALIDGRAAAGLVTGTIGTPGKTGFVFTGQGAQRIGMGRQLYEAYPVFAEAFDAVCAGLEEHLGGSLAAVIAGGAGDLDQTMWTQAGLFALEVALYRLLESWGVTPSVVAGHSIGELAAAHVAGVWSLPDACAVVAARGRFMQELPAGGAMIAIEAGEERVAAALAGRAGAAIAAVNGPKSVVVSGVEADVEAVAAELAASGARTRRLQVSHAFHSPLMDPMLERFARVVASVGSREPRLTLVSTRTGRPVTSEVTDPGYWVGHVRDAVRFADAAGAMRELGVRTFVEIGPDGILSGMGPQTRTGDPGEPELWLPALRRGRDEIRTLVTTTAKLHVRGHAVDWRPALPGARRIGLPGYRFQREHYWLASGTAPTDATGLGQTPADHPLLGAAVDLPGTGAVALTGRLSAGSHRWLAEHTIAGHVVLPGAALLDMVVRAGDETGCSHVEELLIDNPIVLPAQGSVQVQLAVSPPEDGRREVTVFTRTAAQPWLRHATAYLTAAGPGADETASWASAWPPAEATEIETDPRVRAAWRRDTDLYAEVELPERTDATGFGLHPELLEAALQVIRGAGDTVPLHWTGVTVHATGATAARVRITPSASGDGVTIELADTTGGPIARVESVVLAPLPPDALDRAAGARRDGLFGVDWIPVDTPAETVGRCAVLGDDRGLAVPDATRHTDLAELVAAVAGGAPAPDLLVACVPDAGTSDVAETARHAVLEVLDLVQGWLAADALHGSRLVVVTERAVDAGPEAEVRPAGAGVTGLVRATANEHPGRVVLADVDTVADAGPLVLAGAAFGWPEFAIRGHDLRIPRLAPASGAPGGNARDAATPAAPAGPDAAVLITGASGALGALVARHLAQPGGPGSQLLLSRRGPQAPGTAELAADVATAGVTVRVLACDVADGGELAAVVADVPLTDVVHAAGALDDGVVAALTPQRVTQVLRAKVDAAWNLHRLTAGPDLRSFVLFSSVAGVVGNVGQASYAAANTFLDSLAAWRRRQGLPAVSVAWGPWAVGMAGELNDADRQRIARQGLRPLPSADGLALLDAAVDRPEPLLVATLMDLRALRRAGTPVPAMLTGLARPGRPTAGRRTATAARNLVHRLVALPVPERQKEILTLVRTEAALVLGLPGPNAIDAGRYFRQLGFDSLTALEFRNRIGESVGVRLPAALVFDYPTPAGLADYLGEKLADREVDDQPVLDQLDRLASLLPAIAQHPGRRSKILARLEALTAGLRADHPDDAPSDEDIAAATDDEIFDLIDKELGI